jgi:8-oxo-dGTP diphosphatase
MESHRAPSVGVGAVAVVNQEILLVRRGHAPSEGLWSLPGGRVEWAETLVEALEREVLEETGLQVEVGDVAGVVERIYADEDMHYVIIDYFVNLAGGKLRAGGDANEVAWVSLQDLGTINVVPRLIEVLHDFGVL